MITMQQIQKVSNAYDLLKLVYNTTDLTTIEPPISVDQVMSHIQGLSFSNELSFEDWDKSGYIKVNRDINKQFQSVHLWVNPSEGDQRQRFTKAHELGHLVHDIAPKIDNLTEGEEFVDKLNRDGKTSFVERRANKFAAQLLMPLDLVKSEVNKLVEQVKREGKTATVDEAISKLSVIFNVSTQAMGFRLKDLGYIK
ncbi:ImmA/IrrE family metallo-endopeptidase [Pseudoalteromonas sp. PA2MD11]|uniref:ImmA/IrrE family metallo-endopeptidase n=1 Tax=Pseudoalteromonas sp. PA2MD11 TaxID=2785057 RepID=UPI001AE03075|nr:ImmA/IrrE family metallo-endopeptidase [Pseudoalteromonas sp. PA2MD11]